MIRVDLKRALNGLSELQRQILILFEYEGMSGEDIAELHQMKLNTVWSHLRRARSAVLAVLDSPLKNRVKEGK